MDLNSCEVNLGKSRSVSWPLYELGADIRWASYNIFSTQDHAATAIADKKSGSADEKFLMQRLKKSYEKNLEHWTKIAENIRGVSEETTTGVHRLYPLAAEKKQIEFVYIPQVYFNNKYFSEPMSIFLSRQLSTQHQEEHNMLCSSWCWGIFSRVIKKI